MNMLVRVVAHGLALCCISLSSLDASAIQINEIRSDQPSTDNDEYFELVGSPGESLDGMTYLVVGDGTKDAGTLEAVIDLAGLTIPADGYFLATKPSFSFGGPVDLEINLNFENNDNVTHLLVTDFAGAVNDDIDDDNDGLVNESLPWEMIVDSIGLVDSFDEGEPNYATQLDGIDVGPNGPFRPDHVFRQNNEGSVWVIGEFDPTTGMDTPGIPNDGTVIMEASCDFNGDGSCDTTDLSSVDGFYSVGSLTEGVTVPPADAKFDLTSNSRVDVLDLEKWLSDAATENGLPSAYLGGDTDLNGRVEFSDFVTLSSRFGTGTEWSDGDFDGDGTVSFVDFVTLSNNFNMSNVAGFRPVPEPGFLILINLVFFGNVFLFRR